jgi:hypothetical protein
MYEHEHEHGHSMNSTRAMSNYFYYRVFNGGV